MKGGLGRTLLCLRAHYTSLFAPKPGGFSACATIIGSCLTWREREDVNKGVIGTKTKYKQCRPTGASKAHVFRAGCSCPNLSCWVVYRDSYLVGNSGSP